MSRQPYHPRPLYGDNFSPPFPCRQPFRCHQPPPQQYPHFPPPQQQPLLPHRSHRQQQWFPPGQHQQQQQQPLQQQQQHLYRPPQQLQQQQQYQRSLSHHQNQRPPGHFPFNPPGHAPVYYRDSGSGWPAPGNVRLPSSSSSSTTSCFQPRGGVAPHHHDGQSPRFPTNQPLEPHSCPTQPGGHGARYPPTSRDREGCAENKAVSGREREKTRSSSSSSGEALPERFSQRGRGDGQPGVQSSGTRDPSPLPPHQERGRSAGQASRGLPGHVHAAAARETQSQQRQQKMPEGKSAAPQCANASSSPRKETSPRSSKSPEVAEPRAKKAKGKGANRKAGNKAVSKKDKEREVLRQKMRDHVLRVFPYMHRQPYIVPPVRILDRLKCTQLEKYSVHNYSVSKQPEIQDATLLGYKTEDSVTRWLANIINSMMDEAVFFLSNYEFDDFLCYLKVRVKGDGNSNAAAANIKDDSSNAEKETGDLQDATNGSENAEGKADSSQAANSESQNAAAEGPAAAHPEMTSPTGACGQAAATPASGPSLITCVFPIPDDLDKNMRRGDFDALMFSPQYGFVIVESKTMMGEAQPDRDSGSLEADSTTAGQADKAEAGSMRPEAQDEDFRKTIRKALRQLQKEENVLRHLTSDLVKDPPVTKLMALPNKSREDLRRLLEDHELFEECRNTLGTRTVDETLLRCITSDLVNESREPQADDVPREETDGPLSPGQQWWRALLADIADRNNARRGEMAACAMDDGADDSEDVEGETTAAFSGEVFEEIIGRFCGPYSRVPGRTVPDCIYLTGVLSGRSILRSDQLDVLESDERFLLIKGPPGCGKTLLLGLKASEWAKKGDQVVVVCSNGVNYGSLVSWQLRERVVYVAESQKRREMKKAKFAADAAAAAAAAIVASAAEDPGGSSGEGAGGDVTSCSGEGGGGDNNDDVPAKDAAKKNINSPRWQTKKNKNKNRRQTLSSSSSESTEGPDRTSAQSGGTRVPQKNDSEHVAGQNENHPSDGPDEPRSRLIYWDRGDITVDNVHLACITSETNVDEFVSELLGKHGKGNLRVILDESPKKHETDFIPKTLNQARDGLTEMVGVYEQLLKTFADRVEKFYNNNDKTLHNKGPEPDGNQSLKDPVEGAASRTESEAGSSNGHAENSNRTVSNPKPCLAEQKEEGHVNDKRQEEGRGKEAGEKPLTEVTISEENATEPPSKVPLGANKGEEATAENSALQPSVASLSKQFKADDYFATMDDRMEKLANRFKLVLAGVSVLKAEWNDTVLSLFETYKEVRDLSERAAGMTRGTPECCIAKDVVVLEQLKGLMVSVMGFMFGVSNALHVFKVHQFLSVITTTPRTTRPLSLSSQAPPTRRDAPQTLSASPLPQVPSAPETQNTPPAGKTVVEKVEEERVTHAQSNQRTGTSSLPESPTGAEGASQTGLPQTTQGIAQAESASDTGSASQEEETSLPAAELSVWVATVYPEDLPGAYTKVELTRSLRCTPNVQKILKWTEADVKTQVPPGYRYITRACDANPPLPSDGPPVKWFDHAPHVTSHSEVNDCPECGEALVNYLVNTLGLKKTSGVQERTRGQRGGKKKQDEEAQLYFHDVVISGSPIHQPDCAFTQKLKQQGISVLYENQEMEGPPPYADSILVIGGSVVQGLETKIAIYVPELKRITAEEKAEAEKMTSSSAEDCSDEDRVQLDKLKRMGTWNRDYLYMVASRSLSHLIIFH